MVEINGLRLAGNDRNKYLGVELCLRWYLMEICNIVCDFTFIIHLEIVVFSLIIGTRFMMGAIKSYVSHFGLFSRAVLRYFHYLDHSCLLTTKEQEADQVG